MALIDHFSRCCAKSWNRFAERSYADLMSPGRAGSYSIQSVADGECDVLQIYGEIDVSNVHDFAGELAQWHPARNVIIDLRAVDFLDATGVGGIIDAVRIRQDRGTTVEVVRPQHGRGARRVLDILQLHTSVPVHDEYADAADAAGC